MNEFVEYGEPDLALGNEPPMIPQDKLTNPFGIQEIEVANNPYTELPYRTVKKDTGKARLYLAMDGELYWIPIACIVRDDNEGMVYILESFKLKALVSK